MKGRPCSSGDGYAPCQMFNGECVQCGELDLTDPRGATLFLERHQEEIKDVADRLNAEVHRNAILSEELTNTMRGYKLTVEELYTERERNRQMVAGKVADDQQHARALALISERQAKELAELRAERDNFEKGMLEYQRRLHAAQLAAKGFA